MMRYVIGGSAGALLALPAGYFIELTADRFHHSFWEWLIYGCMFPSEGAPADQFGTCYAWAAGGLILGICAAVLAEKSES